MNGIVLDYLRVTILQLLILASLAFITWCPARPSGWPSFPSTSAPSSETAGGSAAAVSVILW